MSPTHPSPTTTALQTLSHSLSSTTPTTTTTQKQSCITTILHILDNILKDPSKSNTKIRKLKCVNGPFYKRAGKWKGSIDFLLSCGFVCVTASSTTNNNNNGNDEEKEVGLVVVDGDAHNANDMGMDGELYIYVLCVV